MSMGHIARNTILTTIMQYGKTIEVYNSTEPGDLPSFEAKALQHTDKGGGSFQFAEQQDIKRGSILKVKGGRDLWRVIDTEDSIEDNVLICFRAHVEKVDDQGNQIYVNNEGRLYIGGDVQGGIQVGGSHNVQNVSISINPKFDEAVNALLQLINKDKTLNDYQKEDAIEAVQKLPALAKKEQSEDVIKRAKDKLELFKSIISISKDLAVLAAPYLPIIAQHFHLLS